MKVTSKVPVTYEYAINRGRRLGSRKQHLCWLMESVNIPADTDT